MHLATTHGVPLAEVVASVTLTPGATTRAAVDAAALRPARLRWRAEPQTDVRFVRFFRPDGTEVRKDLGVDNKGWQTTLLLPGTYEVVRVGSLNELAAPITVAPGETATHTLQFAAPRLSIRVQTGGTPIADKMVYWVDARAGVTNWTLMAGWSLGKTDADGRVRFPRASAPPALRLRVGDDKQLHGPFEWPAGVDELTVTVPR